MGMIELRDADRLHGGQVEFLVQWAGAKPAECPAVIDRARDGGRYLGKSGWQATEHRFQPTEIYEEGGRLVLRFGPDMVDNVLRDHDVVEIRLPLLGIEDRLEWIGITRSQTVVAPPRVEKPAPAPVKPVVAPPVVEALPPPEPEPIGDPRGPKWLLPVLALVLLAALAGAGWWFTRAEPEVSVTVAEPEPVLIPETEMPDAEPPPEPVDAGLAAYDRALAAIAAGDCGAARPAMLEAIELDHAPALLAWAEGQDSLDFTACLTETSNDISALGHYRRACAANVPEAPAALGSLIAALERQADAGEGAAGDVLRLAVPDAREACGI